MNKISREPLYVQVAENLEQKIKDGEVREKLPGEYELTKIYGVARGTVREAIRVLTTKGLVEPKSGVGTQILAEPKSAIGRERNKVFLDENWQSLTALNIHLGNIADRAADSFVRQPNVQNLETLILAKMKRAQFHALADPIWEARTNQLSEPALRGKEHLLIPVIRQSFSEELRDLESK